MIKRHVLKLRKLHPSWCTAGPQHCEQLQHLLVCAYHAAYYHLVSCQNILSSSMPPASFTELDNTSFAKVFLGRPILCATLV
mmetsp:Transcript_88070/g.247587  ORF Transcript_88070/g.247587 Transcript_88070/m.247587 type:complete len:82 (-) Transcript_88070:167-412(-)